MADPVVEPIAAAIGRGEALRAATRALTPGSASARLDAEVLLAAVLDRPRERLYLDHDAPLEGEQRARFDALIERRAAGEPVAYLVGRRAFRTLDLRVDPRVLIPRPETEELVEAALATLPHGASVLDVGTGSGAIALALVAERPDLDVRARDVSPDALACARENASRLGLRLSFELGDLLTDAAPVDAVVANLPYVDAEASLPRDVADHEPALALRAGDGGLALIARLIAQVAALPRARWLLLEIGEDQGARVERLLRAAGFPAVEIRPDLSGRDRIAIASREGAG